MEKLFKKAKTKISRKTAMLIAAIAVTAISLAGTIVAGIFIFKTLEGMSEGAFQLSEKNEETIETINTEQLSELERKIQRKNALDEPRAGRLRNPFAKRGEDAPPAPDIPSSPFGADDSEELMPVQ